MTRREEILLKIAEEESKLSTLRNAIEAATLRLAELRAELAAQPAEGSRITPASDIQGMAISKPSNAQKIAVFRSLFRGREDVFPVRWENPRTGKSGYSPACENEWKHGVCRKIKSAGNNRTLTCGECSQQKFRSVSDEEIARHLRGQQVMGVYPLLPDDTCWFVALDFDGENWQPDVGAFTTTSRELGFHPAVERSRSGAGAHAWFFFSTPVSAASARALGCILLTETMYRHRQLSMRSYDRLFPNQDTLPKGGFGNLIALPLQRDARSVGYSVFVDDGFAAYPDQWQFLASVERIGAERLRSAVVDASRRDRVLGLRESPAEHALEDIPILELPLKQVPQPAALGGARGLLRVIISNCLSIPKRDLPLALLNDLKRLAAFANPEFYMRQRMRLSTALTPRIIACFEEHGEFLLLPRGCAYEAGSLLANNGFEMAIEDRRNKGVPLDVMFTGELTPLQAEAVQGVKGHDIGVIVAPPGTGKTVMACWLIAERKRNTLVVVHRRELLAQWVVQLQYFLGLHRESIGRVGGGNKRRNGQLDVAMLQSLVHHGEVDPIVEEYGQIVVDECHHVPAYTFERVLSRATAAFVLGLTATPQRRDGQHPIIEMQLGPVRFAVKSRERTALESFRRRLVVRRTEFRMQASDAPPGIQELYSALATDNDRNDLIFDDVISALENHRSPVLLTERRDHLDHFVQRFERFTRNLIFLHGKMTRKERAIALSRMEAIPEGEERLVVSTGRYLGEGFDDARLDTLFLALPVSWKGTLVQYAGRLHRARAGKSDVIIYDYVDHHVPVLQRMFERRLRGYRVLGYDWEDESTQF